MVISVEAYFKRFVGVTTVQDEPSNRSTELVDEVLIAVVNPPETYKYAPYTAIECLDLLTFNDGPMLHVIPSYI